MTFISDATKSTFVCQFHELFFTSLFTSRVLSHHRNIHLWNRLISITSLWFFWKNCLHNYHFSIIRNCIMAILQQLETSLQSWSIHCTIYLISNRNEWGWYKSCISLNQTQRLFIFNHNIPNPPYKSAQFPQITVSSFWKLWNHCMWIQHYSIVFMLSLKRSFSSSFHYKKFLTTF